ncbi:MAG TPA: hypothetical protein DCQ26_01385 [Marinilabiliales bacterium]|nr:MAG: hypothetical protein A2W96_18975 [Bacteroidetes bacterium GWD2_40_43]OFX92627.1 MAG: hypothetical protein A2W97_08975 [Bacteroidetes bacterium GWE2_40_63]OFY17484.1 MAG: hypothetical protein A2W88_13735 [Bacteroidetes bacterium GWF2_40_13]HAM97235.1 hypothetical protein [Marinilabiliales bacterium]HBX85899.1 hypothetical protein [Marinilabiliales bacterium]
MRKITNWRNNLLQGLLALFLTFTMSSQSWGQALIEENFDYTIGSLLTANGWTAHSGTGTESITVTDGLSFTHYAGSGIGGAALLDNTGEDVNRTFTVQTSGSIYAALIVKTSATNSEGYFFHFGQNPWNTTYSTRLWVKATGDALGIGASVATWVPITPDTPTLVVVKYNIDTKESSLYVFNTLPTSEPATADATYTETSATTIGGIGLRQFNAAENVIVDGIRVATTWADAVPVYTPSVDTDILTFSLSEQSADATINTTDHTVSIEVVAGTDVTALVPTITLSEGATINPASGVAQDFTAPVVYTVTAEDGTTNQAWTVTVTVAALPSSEAEILTFSFVEEVSGAVINSEAATITSLVEWDADLTKLEPTITVSVGAQVTATVLPVDFSSPVVYRVTAQDLTTTKDWTVTVTKDAEPNHAAEITAFELTQLSAAVVINSETATITGVLVAGTDVTGLTPTLTLSEGATYTPSGAQDFTNAVVYTVTAQDGETTKDWTVTLTVLEIESVTIHDIQFTEDASGDSPLINQVVKTKGVVTALEAKAFYLQDGAGAWNSVYVYQNAAPTVVVGDSILIEGKISEYNKLTEITNPVITVLNSGNAVAAATALSVADFKQEMYEGVLVTISNVTCVSEVVSKNWKVKAVASTDTVIVRNGIFDYTPVLGQVFVSITGFGGQYKTDYQLFPRSAEDIVITSVFDEQLALVNIYPNPVESELKLDNLDGVSSIMISNILGQTMKTLTVNSSAMNIDLSKLNNGIYVVTLKSVDGTTRSERIIKK